MQSDPLVNSYYSGVDYNNPDNWNLLTDNPEMVYNTQILPAQQQGILEYNMKVDEARKSKSVFSDDFNDGQGNYTYNMNGISVTHNEQLNGAIDFNTFRNISVAQVNNVEKYIANQLNAFHNEYKKMRTNDVNKNGVDAAGFYYEFDWSIGGGDVLEIEKYDYSGNKVETLEIDLPTVDSEDFEGMWSKAYTDYVNFLTQNNANAKKIAVDQVVFNWNDWVLDMKGSENLQDYLTKIQPNTSDIVSGSKYDKGGQTTIKKGNQRGGISKVSYQKGIGAYKRDFDYWTSGVVRQQLFADGKGLSSQPFNVRYGTFVWPPGSGKVQYYQKFTDFVPPEYDKEGRLVNANSIGKFEAYEFMYDDYTRGKKVLEDVYYKATGDEYDYAKDTGGDIIGEGTLAKGDKVTNADNQDKLKELEKELDKEVYSETEYNQPMTFVDINQQILENNTRIIDSKAFGEEWLNKQLEFDRSFNSELEEKLEPHKEDIENILNNEFGEELNSIEQKINSLKQQFEAEDEEILQSLAEEIENQLVTAYERGDIDFDSNEEFETEFNKRLQEAYNAHHKAVLKDREKLRSDLVDPFNKKYNDRYNELAEQYVGEFINKKTKELETIYYDFQSKFIEDSYKNKTNGAEQLISDDQYTEIFKRLHDQNIHGYGYKVKQKAIDVEWARLSHSLKASGISDLDA